MLTSPYLVAVTDSMLHVSNAIHLVRHSSLLRVEPEAQVDTTLNLVLQSYICLNGIMCLSCLQATQYGRI